ncbi:unnamed protein product [Clavelina lepadiformis]|uniref:Uncharacterized protein n=1 Tax=Clavelina lepadiformis TaxID=159417 RepID=A0ABP0FUI6_CLALP
MAKYVLMFRSLDRRRKTLPIQESPSSFNWEEILNDFCEFLKGHDGGAHEESMARDKVHLIRNIIIEDCEFGDLQSFTIEAYKQKHVQKLQKEKKTPATFISHSNAMTNFLNIAIMRKLPLSFNVGEALLNLKNRRASYRKFLKKRRQVIRENDRRNALDPKEVDRVMKNSVFQKAALATELWENNPGEEVRRAHGEILMVYLIVQNSQRTRKKRRRRRLVADLTTVRWPCLSETEVDNEEMRKKNRRSRGGSEDPRGAPLPHDRRKSTATASP